MKRLVVSSGDYENKLALLENDKLVEILIERINEKDISRNFYKARVVDIVDGIESIFVDMGFEKNAFLNVSKLKNKKIFNKNEDILVQVEANLRDDKSIKLTLDYSISSKNLVLLPNSSKGLLFSSKISEALEKERLRGIFSKLIKDKGLIIRTSALFIPEEELKKEYESLILKWETINKNFKKARNGGLVYSQNSITEKLFQEYLDESIDEFIVCGEEIFTRIKEYIENNNLKSLYKKLKKFFKDEDIFEYYGINRQIKNALNRKVWLNSGGYLVIEKTEALVSIDVNSGGNTKEKSLEDVATKTNLEAAVEIVRQMRLRNLAGIIVIDFIDMKKNSNKKLILKTLENELKNDKMKTTIINYSPLNLLQLTRQREGFELSKYYQESCPHCHGTGFIRSSERIVLEILEELKKSFNELDIKNVELLAEKAILEKIEKDYIDYIEILSKKKNKKVIFIEENNLEKNYKINLYR